MKYKNQIIIVVILGLCVYEASSQDNLASISVDSEASTVITTTAESNEEADPEKRNQLMVNISAVFTSRFIWRGLELGDHPHIQPEITFSFGDFFFGSWASHGIAPVAFDETVKGYKEVIPYIGYNFELSETSKLSLILLDHYNPNFGEIGDWGANGDGSNTLEVRTILTAGKFDFLGSINVYNDSDNSNYIEIGYNASLPNDFSVRPLVSFTPTKSPFNGTDDFAFTQVGVIGSKTIKLSEDITLPIKVDFIINPNLDRFFTAFSVAVKM